MKKIFEVFVAAGQDLEWDSCNEPVFKKQTNCTERKCYTGNNWREVFVEALADFCNVLKKRGRIDTARVGIRYHGDEPTVHEADAGSTVYIPVLFGELVHGEHVFGIHEVNIEEKLNDLKVVPENY